MKAFAILFAFAVLQQSCVERMAGPPEKLSQEAAQQFRPYFPNVQAHADPRQQIIMVLTCAQGLGAPFFATIEPQVAQQLQNNPKLQQLRMASIAEVFGQRIPYNQLAVVFEDRMLVWKRMDGKVYRVPNPPELTRRYREACAGISAQPRSVSASPSVREHDPLECNALRGALLEVTDLETRAGLEEAQRRRFCADARPSDAPTSPAPFSKAIQLTDEECGTLGFALEELKLKSSERATIGELVEMQIRYCSAETEP